MGRYSEALRRRYTIAPEVRLALLVLYSLLRLL